MLSPKISKADEVVIEGSIFVLTGDFSYGTRNKVEEYIITRGGKVTRKTTRNTNFVVKGRHKSKEYGFGDYGTKVKESMDLQSKGFDVRIIDEGDLLPMSAEG